MKKFAMTAVVLSLLAAISPLARATLIDSFEEGAFSLTSFSPNNNVGLGADQTGLAGVLGGERGPSVLLWDQGYTSGSATLALDLSGPGDHGATLSVPAGRTATGGFGYFGTPGTGLGVDLTEDGISSFLFTFSHDPGTGTLGIDVEGPAGRISHSISLTGAATYEVPFSAFNPQNNDFANVHTLGYYMICTAGSQPVTATLSDVRTVPEPSVFVLLAAGVCGLTAFAWRRRA
jgi:hypothetical protein